MALFNVHQKTQEHVIQSLFRILDEEHIGARDAIKISKAILALSKNFGYESVNIIAESIGQGGDQPPERNKQL